MRKGTISRLMAADRLYGEFYGFYSFSPEYFGCTVVEMFASCDEAQIGLLSETNICLREKCDKGQLLSYNGSIEMSF
jgi:hypothetical protein